MEPHRGAGRARRHGRLHHATSPTRPRTRTAPTATARWRELLQGRRRRPRRPGSATLTPVAARRRQARATPSPTPSPGLRRTVGARRRADRRAGGVRRRCPHLRHPAGPGGPRPGRRPGAACPTCSRSLAALPGRGGGVRARQPPVADPQRRRLRWRSGRGCAGRARGDRAGHRPGAARASPTWSRPTTPTPPRCAPAPTSPRSSGRADKVVCFELEKQLGPRLRDACGVVSELVALLPLRDGLRRPPPAGGGRAARSRTGLRRGSRLPGLPGSGCAAGRSVGGAAMRARRRPLPAAVAPERLRLLRAAGHAPARRARPRRPAVRGDRGVPRRARASPSTPRSRSTGSRSARSSTSSASGWHAEVELRLPRRRRAARRRDRPDPADQPARGEVRVALRRPARGRQPRLERRRPHPAGPRPAGGPRSRRCSAPTSLLLNGGGLDQVQHDLHRAAHRARQRRGRHPAVPARADRPSSPPSTSSATRSSRSWRTSTGSPARSTRAGQVVERALARPRPGAAGARRAAQAAGARCCSSSTASARSPPA